MVFLFSTVIILVLDQTSKRFFLAQGDLPWWLVEDHVGFELSMNEGIAFSLPVTGGLSIAMSSIVVVLILTYYYLSLKKTRLSAFTIALIVAGAVGNISDRLSYGAVVDFIKISVWPTFNFADAAITIGFFLLILFYKRLHLPPQSKK